MRVNRINRVTVSFGALAVVLGGISLVAEAAGPPGAAAVQPPPAGARWDYQIGGGVEYSPAPGVVSRDAGDLPWSGVYSICYLNAFQSQPGDRSLQSSWLVVGGSTVEDPNWRGEYVLDTRGHRAELVQAFTAAMSGCAAKGFRAVEFDNLDSYERSRGGLTRADNLAYVRDLIDVAHGLGLAAAQKNSADLAGAAPFDFAVTESCLRYDECGDYTAAYPVVLDVEYEEELSASAFQTRCAAAVAAGRAPSFVFRDLAVSGRGVRQWCSAQPVTAPAPGTTPPTASVPTASVPPTSVPTSASTTSSTRTVTPSTRTTISSTRTTAPTTRTTAPTTRTTAPTTRTSTGTGEGTGRRGRRGLPAGVWWPHRAA